MGGGNQYKAFFKKRTRIINFSKLKKKRSKQIGPEREAPKNRRRSGQQKGEKEHQKEERESSTRKQKTSPAARIRMTLIGRKSRRNIMLSRNEEWDRGRVQRA